MKRNRISNRSLKFIERNSPKSEKVRKYINNLATKAFGLKQYDFIEIENNMVFYIEGYYLVLDETYIELQLYKNGIKINSFLGDSCWYQGLKFITENLKILNERRE